TAAAGPHAIREVRAFQVPATQSTAPYIVLQIRTASGLTGYGECRTLTSAELNSTKEAITGRAATSYEVLDPLVPRAVLGALNIALLDILGKATNAPVYRILGGPTRNKARAITRLSGNTDAELTADLALECSAELSAGDTAALATSLEKLHPLWFDEPCAVSNIATLHKISDE